MKDPVSEISEVAHTKASPLEDFSFVVAALNESVCPWYIHGVQNLIEPVVIGFGTVVELRQIHDLDSQQPVCKPSPALRRGLGSDHSKEVILNTIGVSKPWSDLKHECQLRSLIV